MPKKKSWEVVELPLFGKDGCKLVVCQLNIIPELIEAEFESASRVYLINNPTDKPSHRGQHVHLQPSDGSPINVELMYCITGTATAVLHSANGCEEIQLDSPTKALLIRDGWHDIVVNPGGILVVIASTDYNPDSDSNDKPCNCS